MDIDIRPATSNDLTYIDSLQKKNAEELAFYPKAVFEREVENLRLILAMVNNEPAGYLYHGAFSPVVKIHQACIEYDLRGQLYGSALVRELKSLVLAAGGMSITLRCGSDLQANKFWEAMGFYCQGISKGGVRRMRDINNWRLDLQPQLFVSEVTPSVKQKDASLWRKHKDANKTNSMLRGKNLRSHREMIERLEAERVNPRN